MANNSPTIVAASLSDDQLKKSIDSLVTHVDEAMKKMVQSTNNAVGEMEAKLKSLGSLKIDTGGSNDGGTGRRTQQHEKLTKAVNDASEAVTKETQKLQDLQQSLSGASDREQNFISQKERAANTIAQENELLNKQQSELSALKAQQQSLVDAEQRGAQAKQQNAAAIEKQRGAVKYYEEEIVSLQARLTSAQAKADRFWEVQAKARESISSRLHAPSDQFIGYNDYERGKSVYYKTEQDVRSLIKALSELDNADKKHGFGDALRRGYINLTPSQDMANVFKRQQEEISSYIKTLQEAKKSAKGETRANLDSQIVAAKDLLAIYKEIGNAQNTLNKTVQKEGLRDGGNVGGIKRDIEETQRAYGIAKQKLDELTQSTQQSSQASQQKAQIDAQVAAKEKEIAETKGRIATAIRKQADAEAGASQAAREKANIQGQVANQEKKVAEAKKQLTTATQQQTEVEKQSVQNIAQQTAARDKQIKKNQEVATSFDQMAKAQQVAIRSASPSGIRNADTLQTMNIQLDLLRERLREAKQQYSSFVALAAHATTTGDKGLFQYATDGVHRYEQEVRNLIPQIRTLQNGIQQMGDVIAPQGHTIQNYVNSLQKANPELAALNAQYKSGTSLLQDQSTSYISATQSAQRYTEEIRKQAQAIRESKQWKETGTYSYQIGDATYYVSKKQGEIEAQLVRHKEQQVNYEKEYLTAGMAVESKTQQQLSTEERLSQVEQQRLATELEIAKARREYISPTTTTYTAPTTDMLRKFIASKAGVDVKDVKIFDETAASASKLQSALKQVQTAYSNMSAEERNSPFGQALIRRLQELQREAQKTQRQLSRPVSLKDALGGSEKTLDDIVYKMQRLSSYRSGLDTNAQHNEIRRVNYEYDVLKKKMDEVMQKNSQMVSSNTALGRSWNYMKNRLAFYFTVGASTQFVKNLIEVRSQYEMNERALGILVDSAERGTQIFRELSDMALVSPYTLIELSSAAKQLTAYDVAAKDVVDTTRRLADMASAVGVPVERLTYALGQIKAYGYLNSRDARMFANAGIPLVKELADHYTTLEGRLVSTADVYDRIKKKAIDYNDVMQVMNEMTDEGGKFYDFQAKMADTLKVQLANLTLAWNNMLNDLGNSQQGLLTGGIGALKELFLHWKDLDRILTNLAITIGTAKAAQLLLNMSFGKGTLAAIKNISAIEGNTAAMYENALSKSNLSKAEARWLVSTNRSNVALRAAMVNMKLLTVEEAKAAASTTVLGVRMGWLGRVMKTNFFGLASVVRGAVVGMEMLGKAMLSIVTNPVFLSITAAMALVDALLYYNQIAEKTAEMNKAIADNAKEASEAIGDYLKDSVNIGNRAKAAQGVLSVSEGQKAWESIREQIELSSDAASVFISKLLEEEDINKRVKEGFDVAESIREATNAMAGLNAEAIKVSQDSWLWGAFGEGLAEDLEDYIEAVQRGRKNGANIGSQYFAAGERKEAKDELTAFANDAEEIIRDRLGAGVNDAVQLKEAIERIKKEVIAANPQIKGEVKKWFDVEVDRMMAERFGGVYNELSSIQSQFIEHIKRDSGAALRRLSDDILDTSKELDDDVLGAISKAWDKLKDELPAESQDLISKLQKQMDENPLTLRVLLLQAGEQQIRDAIQNDYEKHFYDANIGEKPTRPKDVGSLWGDYKGDFDKFAAAQKKHEKEMVEYNQKNAEWEAKRAEYVAKYGDFNKKNDETRAKWAKRVNDEIKAADAEEKAAKHARESLEAELSLEERKTDARYLSAVKEEQEAKNRKAAAQEAWNYEKLYQEEKGKGRKGSKKDPLLDALKQEISLVEKLQSDYDKLTKSGASQAEALETIRGAYGKTIRLLNAQLGRYGLPQLDISQLITGKDPNKVLAHFKQTLDTLVSKGMLTLERSKELEAVVEKFTLSAKIYNLDKITKGLNNELGKLKEEYELAVELDANPEMGNLFSSMFGLDESDMPRTFDQLVDKAQRKIDEIVPNNIGVDIKVNNLDDVDIPKDSIVNVSLNVPEKEADKIKEVVPEVVTIPTEIDGEKMVKVSFFADKNTLDEVNNTIKDREITIRVDSKDVDKLNMKIDDSMIETKKIDMNKLLDINAWEEFKKTSGQVLGSDMLKIIEDYRNYLVSTNKKIVLETSKSWDSLVQKYGDLQSKLVKIQKDATKERLDVIKEFGTEEQKSAAIKIYDKIKVSQDPADIAAMQSTIQDIVRSIVDNNPIALKVVTASQNEEDRLQAKAQWEEFKNSNLYTMTFDDMANNSTESIRVIIDKLNELKDKVKEDPASMKALMQSLSEAESELRKRNPFAAVVEGLKDWKNAADNARIAQEKLNKTRKVREDAQKDYDESEDSDPDERAESYRMLTDAVEDETKAEENNNDAQNEKKKALEKVSKAMNDVGERLTQVGSIVGQIGDIYKAFGNPNEYDETAEAIGDIAASMEGAGQAAQGVSQIMSGDVLNGISNVIGGVWGAVSTWFDNSNKKIDAAIKESEREVKKLEKAYKDLEDAANKAYGATTSGAKRATIANKELQLAEIKRQIQLEKSRDAKDRDQDRILELESEYKDLVLEIKNGISDIVNEMLDISSAGDGITSIVDSMIQAFRSGEDAMQSFSESWDKMIDNMILKLVISTFMQKAWDGVLESLNQKEEEMLADVNREKAETQEQISNLEHMSDDEIAKLIADEKGYGTSHYAHYDDALEDLVRGSVRANHSRYTFDTYYIEGWQKVTDEEIEAYKRMLEESLNSMNSEIDKTSLDYTKWAIDFMSGEGREKMQEQAKMLTDALGQWYTFGEDKDSQLSALQQGIQGITEDTAGALESYMNGVSQQVYYQSDLLTQIRDTILGFDLDIQMGVLSEILLQLQSSYQIQMSIRDTLQGWSNASGMAVRVEMI